MKVPNIYYPPDMILFMMKKVTLITYSSLNKVNKKKKVKQALILLRKTTYNSNYINVKC